MITLSSKGVVQSSLRILNRSELEQLCIELAKDLREFAVVSKNGEPERQVETADEASEQGLQSLAMVMDPSHDYVGLKVNNE